MYWAKGTRPWSDLDKWLLMIALRLLIFDFAEVIWVFSAWLYWSLEAGKGKWRLSFIIELWQLIIKNHTTDIDS